MGIIIVLAVAVVLAFVVFQNIERTRRHAQETANFSREWLAYLVEITVPHAR
jgi:hypothetical protein